MAPSATTITSAIPARRSFKALCTNLFPLIDPAGNTDGDGNKRNKRNYPIRVTKGKTLET